MSPPTSNQNRDDERGQLFARVNTLEKELAVVAQKHTDQSERFNSHLTTCAGWQQSMYAKLDSIQTELQNRLPRWATVGGIVTFSILSAAIGWLAKSQGAN